MTMTMTMASECELKEGKNGRGRISPGWPAAHRSLVRVLEALKRRKLLLGAVMASPV